MSKNLHLVLKFKWFDMIASGEKLEEYREINPYWQTRLFPTSKFSNEGKVYNIEPKGFETITFQRGYSKNAPQLIVKFLGLSAGQSRPKWSENAESKHCFIIKFELKQ